jgi:hypothetical protein
VLKSLSKGVATVGVLVSATAVLNTTASWFNTPLTDWLSTLISAYRGLFFPMIDASIGRIFQIFGYQIAEWAKNLIVFYLAFGASMVRTGQKEGPISSIAEWLTMLFLWPFLIVFTLVFLPPTILRLERQEPEEFIEIKGLHSGSKSYLGPKGVVRSFFLEFFIVILLAGFAMLLSASGVLK